MKRLIKGGFLTLSGVIGVIGTMMVAMQNPSSAWETPPGRMVTSILENEMLIPAILFLLLLGQHRINAKNRIIQWVPNKNCE